MPTARTINSLVKDAVRFYKEQAIAGTGIYIGIGRQTPWGQTGDDLPDGVTEGNDGTELNPPLPNQNATGFSKFDGVEDVIAYKKCSEVYLVVPVDPASNPQGQLITWRGGTYQVVVPAEGQTIDDAARIAKAYWVYYKAEFIEDEVAACAFRQIATFTGLTKANEVSVEKTLLLPAEIASVGLMETIENRKATPHEIDSTEVIEYVREF